jgi:lipoprotein-anchoring transpeptidase ErfK/SrfK
MTKHQVRRGGIAVLSLVVAGGIGVVGWQLAPSTRSAEHGPAPRASTKAVAAAQLIMQPSDNATDVPLDQPVKVGVANGRITRAELRDAANRSVPGSVVADGSLWYTETRALAPATRYSLAVTVVDGRGQEHTTLAGFTTATAKTELSWEMTPGDHDLVGIGQPVILKFREPVLKKQAVEQRLTVQASRKIMGAWHWFSDREVHFRPKDYWPANTNVLVVADLQGIDVGNGVWGTEMHSIDFKIGDAQISTADADKHTLTVTKNGKVVNVFPASLGREKYPTMSGAHLVMGKEQKVIMDSATNGIPRNSADGYYETVLWNVRISAGGEYVHAAPWSVADQGNTNVSHGCVNLSTPNATWFFNFSRRGDIVNVVGTGRKAELTDYGTRDWNMPWGYWVAGSALPRGPSVSPEAQVR